MYNSKLPYINGKAWVRTLTKVGAGASVSVKRDSATVLVYEVNDEDVFVIFKKVGKDYLIEKIVHSDYYEMNNTSYERGDHFKWIGTIEARNDLMSQRWSKNQILALNTTKQS